MDQELKRELILENYQHPFHKGLKREGYLVENANNESCIDNLDISIKVEEGRIIDATFDGEACAISTSSCSIMIHNLIGKTIKEAKEYVNNFKNMIDEEPYDEELLGEANAYNNIYKQNNRKHCAYLPYEGILKVLDRYEG